MMPEELCYIPVKPDFQPRVLPKIHECVERFLKHEDLLFSVLDGFGSPLNLIFPQNITDNIKNFESAYQKHHLRGRIYFANKPCKSNAILREASTTNVGLDVSSENSLKQAFSTGFSSDRIIASGPKNVDYLGLALQQDIVINIDSIAELQQLLTLHKALNKPGKTRIMVRLESQTESVSFTPQDKMFGVRKEDVPNLIDLLVEQKNLINFLGFSFHYSAKDIVRKIPAIEKALEYTFECIKKGLAPKGLNIGGGYRTTLAADRTQWHGFVEGLKDTVRGAGVSMTWNDTGLGYYCENGQLKGSANFMDHCSSYHGADDLLELIEAPLPSFSNRSTARILSESLLELYIEPGRALLDQCGMTAARVSHHKISKQGQQLVMLDMNISNLNITQLPHMLDPIILYRSKYRTPAPDGIFYGGNLCLTHSNIIQHRKTFPEFLPEPGDVILFANTAAYQMDFVETEILQQRVAKKIALVEYQDKVHWFNDDIYNPLHMAHL